LGDRWGCAARVPVCLRAAARYYGLRATRDIVQGEAHSGIPREAVISRQTALDDAFLGPLLRKMLLSTVEGEGHVVMGRPDVP
jgi:hypothetical protein